MTESPAAVATQDTEVDAGLIDARAQIASHLADAYKALSAFIGDPEDDAGADDESVIATVSKTPAHALVVSCKHTFPTTPNLKISTDAEYQKAADDLARIKGFAKRVDVRQKEITAPIRAAEAATREIFRPASAFLDKAESVLKSAMLVYQREQDAKRRAEEAAAAEKARKEQEKLAAQAQKALDSGKVEKAEALLERASTVVAAPVATTSAPRVSGVSTKTTYSAEVTNLTELAIAAVARTLVTDCGGDAAALLKRLTEAAFNNVPLTAIVANTKYLDDSAKALKDSYAIPGTKLVKSESISSRSK